LYPLDEKLEQILTDDGTSGIIFDSLQHICSVVRKSILEHSASSAEKECIPNNDCEITFLPIK
jgi:hypothetical protein